MNIERIYRSHEYARQSKLYKRAAKLVMDAFLLQYGTISMRDSKGKQVDIDINCIGERFYIHHEGEERCRTDSLIEAVCWSTAILEKHYQRRNA